MSAGQSSPASWELDNGYRISTLDRDDPRRAEEVQDLWVNQAGLPPGEARRRLEEVLLIATSPAGELAAVTTVFLQRNDQLRAQVWHMRVFTDRAHRRAHLAQLLTLFGANHLDEMFQSGVERRAIGVLGEIESDALKGLGDTEFSRTVLGEGVWPFRGAVFIGEDDQARHIRIDYFDGALAPEPDE